MSTSSKSPARRSGTALQKGIAGTYTPLVVNEAAALLGPQVAVPLNWLDVNRNLFESWLEWQGNVWQPLLEWQTAAVWRWFEPMVLCAAQPWMVRGEEQLA